ncbi:Abi-alpha family protein [Pseudanabaena sp. BC1403]|uniref:Abi-alpha family protein n=1 Tax=Pseudanabaena sp. BC1403 TaxID=2043171 RepID=UPI000CD84426|nr:Abi-alpha family protein [Pseudanabaena sp. BC1403]
MSEEIKSGLSSTVGGIVKDVVSPSAKIIGSWLGDSLSVNYSQWRAKQAAKVVEGAGEILAELNLKPTICKPKILLPLIEQASLEEDDDLTKKWMGLLASAVIGDSIHPSYSKILSEIIQSEAKIIDYLYSLEMDLDKLQEDKTPEGRKSKRNFLKQFWLKKIQEFVGFNDEEFYLSIDNLLRIRLCYHPDEEESYEVVTETSLDDEELSVNTESITNIYANTEVIRLTRLGKSFVKACRGSSS